MNSKVLRVTFVLVMIMSLVASLPLVALATWSTSSTVNNPICTAADDQEYAEVISDGAGGAIIVWHDYRGTTIDIYAQRVDSSGNTLWADNGTAISTENSTVSSHQEEPRLVSDGAGGAIIVWNDKRGVDDGIYAQRVDASGSANWTDNGTAICTEDKDQWGAKLLSDGAGGAIIAWIDSRYTVVSDNDSIYAQLVNASGIAQWSANGTAICTEIGEGYVGGVVTDGAGGAIIVWEDQRSSSYPDTDIYAQRVNASGIPQWTDNGTAICTAADSQYSPKLVSDGAGGAIIVWRDYRSTTDDDISAQRVNASGIAQWTANGTAISTAANDQGRVQLISDGAGGAIIVWDDERGSVDDDDIYAQRVNASGIAQWSANGTAISTAANAQEDPELLSDGAGGAIIVYEDERDDPDDIYAQRVNSSGIAQWTANGTPVSTAAYKQRDPRLVSDGAGGAIIVWKDNRSDNTTYDIYAQWVDASGTLGSPAPAPAPAPSPPPADEGEPAPPPAIGRVSGIVDEEGVFTSLFRLPSDDEKVTLLIPKGTTGLTTEGEPISKVTVTKVKRPPEPPADANFIGLTYDFEPDGATFDPPITLTFTYNPAWIPEEVDPENLTIAYWDEDSEKWVELDARDITIDTEKSTISVEINHFTYFSVIVYVRPAAITVSDLTITPAEVDIAERVTISVTVTNTGDLHGSYVASLEINGKEVSTKKVTVAGHTTEKVNFTWVEGKPQTYEVNVNGLSGTFTVKPAPTEPIVVKAPPAPSITPAPALPPLVPPAPTPPSPTPSAPATAPTPWWLFVVIAVGTVFVLALALWLFVFRTK